MLHLSFALIQETVTRKPLQTVSLRLRAASFLLIALLLNLGCLFALGSCKGKVPGGNKPKGAVAATPLKLGRDQLTQPILVPGGEFLMGAQGPMAGTDDHWPHRVRVSDFYLAPTELSNEDFIKVYNWAISKGLVTIELGKDGIAELRDKKSRRYLLSTWSKKADIGELPRIEYLGDKLTIDSRYLRHPVLRVSWYAAAAFCNYQSAQEGLALVFSDTLDVFDLSRKGYRLPTEAEWEYAARSGGKEMSYAWGESENVDGNIADEAYYRKFPQHPRWEDYDDGFEYSAPVASFGANSLGLYDMSGNVAEWCINWFYRYPGYENTAFFENPAGPEGKPPEGRYRTWRGGSWFDHGIKLMTTSRGFFSPENAGSVSDLGFRLARSR